MGRGARHYCRTLSRGVAASPRRHQPPAAAADGAGVTRCYKRLRPLVAKCTKISANSVYHTGPAHGRRPLPGHLLGVPILFVLEKFFMKSLFVRSGLALLCAVALASCGGSGGGSMLLSGAITGLTKTGLVLTNGSETVTPLPGDASFQFPNLISVNDSFDIEIKSQPTGAVCKIANNVNTANIYTVQQTVVSCTTNTWTLGGVVNGLKSTGLLISNGSDVVSPTPSATTPGAQVPFRFPSRWPTAPPSA